MIKEFSINSTKIILDNTRFPKNGASYAEAIEIEVFYILDISPSDKFYIYNIASIIMNFFQKSLIK